MFFFFNDTATTEIYTLSLHDALPISVRGETLEVFDCVFTKLEIASLGRIGERESESQRPERPKALSEDRSEEHTSELQSPCNLVCRLLLEKKKIQRRRRALVHMPA